VVLDFDGVIARLRVNWRHVSRALESEGLKRPWESISAMFYRLWREDRGEYVRASRIVEAFEASARVERIVQEEDLKGLDFCVVSMQPISVLRRYISSGNVYGRDSGLGPYKSEMLKACVGGLKQREHVVVFDDDLYNCVMALRLGLYPIRVVQSTYKAVESLRVGVLPLKRQLLRAFISKLKSLN